jgi:hypothetical protein
MSAHEDLQRQYGITGGSDRSFGLVFAAFFLILGLWPLFARGQPRWWAVGISALFGAVSLVRPSVLRPLNRLWTKLGLLLARVVNPISLGVLFFLVIAPFGFVLRRLGKLSLSVRQNESAATYWLPREPAAPGPETIRRQF